uniref:uncharacterized protein LOC125908421 n=1 Tax=Anopheles coluzzii TaxID=1518534 RepID=UPI0020FFE2BE|nr:uncharacterized protein LOC125908421 [Anopheles coluzzii]
MDGTYFPIHTIIISREAVSPDSSSADATYSKHLPDAARLSTISHAAAGKQTIIRPSSIHCAATDRIIHVYDLLDDEAKAYGMAIERDGTDILEDSSDVKINRHKLRMESSDDEDRRYRSSAWLACSVYAPKKAG